MDEHTSVNNAWVESYLDALLTEGLSSEFVRKPGSNEADNVNADSEIFAKYYVSQLLTFGDDALRNAWSKATAVHGHNAQIDARLEYLLWRIWSMNLRQARVKAAQEPAEEPTFIADSGSDEEGAAGGMPGTLPSHSSFSDLNRADAVLTAIHEDVAYDQPASPHSITFENRPHNLYIVLISLHGLVRGQNMELGKDPDTGGQVKYVVELAKNLAQHPMVHRVDLLTRLICDPKVDAAYGQPEECLYQGPGQHGGAYIIRLPCGPKEQYIRKEALWPHVREFADYSIDYIREKLQRMSEDGEGSELYVVHGHYADAGEAAAMIGHTLSADMVMTGHSLGRNKLEHLLKSNTMRRAEIEAAYTISRRIEAEERCLDAAMMVFTSTQQEVDSQWGLYDGYNLRLARAMRGPRARHDRHVPEMRVIPPGLDFSSLKVELPADPLALFGDVQTDAIGKAGSLFGSLGSARGLSPLGTPPSTPPSALGAGSSLLSSALGQDTAALPAAEHTSAAVELDAATPEPDLAPHAVGSLASDMGGIGVAVKQVEEEPRIWKETYKFLRNPYKPVVLAMSRPDAKKNVATLVRAFGSHSVLKNMCNMVLILGNRDHIDSLAPGSKSVIEQVLKLIDAYDLYGSVAYPKKHSQSDISDIYRLAHATRGVFTNIALQEPFGLTLIEAAAHGVPIVATTHGGPVDIIKTLKCGVLVEPTDVEKVGAALLDIVSQPELWEQYSRAGVDNIMAYSWPSHCIRYLHAMEAKKQSREKGVPEAGCPLQTGSCQTCALAGCVSAGACGEEGVQRRERHFGSWDESTFQAALVTPGEGPGKDAAAAAAAAADKPGEPSSIRIGRGGVQEGEAVHRGVDRTCSSPVAAAEAPPMSTLVPGVAPESQGLESSGMAAAGTPPMAQDDVDVLPSGTPSGHPTSLPAAAAAAAGAGGGTGAGGVELLALQQERYVFVTLDTHDTAPLVGLLLQRLRGRAAGAAIGLGLLSMLELQDTKQLLLAEGIDPASLSVLSCSAGAALYYGTSDGQLLADEQYENHLAAAPWNKLTVMRTLQRFRMATGRGNAQQSSRKILRHVMLTDRFDLSASTGPYHVLLEMDRSQDNTRLGHHALMDRIRKHARTSGLRMSLTLQLVPDADAQLPSSCKLHATPINANRPQALRYALCRLGRPLSAATLLLPVHACLPTAAAADGAADAEEVTPVTGYTNDLESLLGGRGCCVLCPPAPASGSAAAEAAQAAALPPEEGDAMQFELRPAQYCGRVRAACDGPDPAVHLALRFAFSDAAPRS